MIGYWGELRHNWRPLLAATFGLATGHSALALYTPSVIAPHLIEEFGWPMGDFAQLQSISLLVAFVIPLIGRLADVWGVRNTVLIGMVMQPLCFMAYSLMTGPLWQFGMIFVIQTVFCVTTTATVYSRLAVQYISAARGLALAIVAVGPTITGLIAGPVLNGYIEANGWRPTYHLLAGFTVVTAIVTLLLLPPERAPADAPKPKRRAREDYPFIFRSRAFWILAISMLLCNFSQVLALSQMKLLVMANGVAAANAGPLLAAFPMGVLAGRFVCGAALDRWPAHWVGLLCMGLPSIGMLLLASSFDAYWLLMAAVVLIGFSYGAEGDLVAYIVAGRIGVELYGSTMGLMTMFMSISTSTGAVVLGLFLERTGNFDAFLTLCAFMAMAGAAMFLLLRREPRAVAQA